MSEYMDYVESRNNEETNLAEPRNKNEFPSTQSGMDVRDEELESLLVDGIAMLTKIRAEVAEMQVECVKLEESFSQENNPKLMEEARQVLDDDISDTMDR